MQPIKIKDLNLSFGTSGLRGLVTELTPRVCFAYASAFLQNISPNAKAVVIGIDLRPSSPKMADACVTAAKSLGLNVIYAGAVPTPALALYAIGHAIPAIMVTGSHIPFDRNGLKFYSETGEINKDDEAKLLNASVTDNLEYLSGLPAQDPKVIHHYKERYLSCFATDLLHGKRLGVYQHSSVARDVLVEVLSTLGAEVIALGRTDEFVPIDTEAISEEDRALAASWVKEFKLDALISTDGDADRPLIADDNGTWLRGDIVGLLCARHLKANTVITPISSNTAIELSGAFRSVRRTRIGSPYVIEGMNQALQGKHQGVIGFEANGGVLIGDDIQINNHQLRQLPTRDALLPILGLLAASVEEKLSLSQLVANLPQRFTYSDRLKDFSKERSSEALKNVEDNPTILAQWLGAHYIKPIGKNKLDGLRMTFENGDILHLRPSGNAPELRCYAESNTESNASALVNNVLKHI
jgi:phosphomannomutase